MKRRSAKQLIVPKRQSQKAAAPKRAAGTPEAAGTDANCQRAHRGDGPVADN